MCCKAAAALHALPSVTAAALGLPDGIKDLHTIAAKYAAGGYVKPDRARGRKTPPMVPDVEQVYRDLADYAQAVLARQKGLPQEALKHASGLLVSGGRGSGYSFYVLHVRVFARLGGACSWGVWLRRVAWQSCGFSSLPDLLA